MNLRRLMILAPVLGVAAALILLTALVRVLEPRFAFFPLAGERVTPREFGVEYERLAITTDDGVRLHGWRLAGSVVRANILYFHGNSGNLSVWAPIVCGIARSGYDVIAFDYRGYGLNSGRPTEQGLYQDVRSVVDHFWSTSSADVPNVYWGRSLGVAMAAYGATVRKPDGLILESGFPDARSLVRGSPLAFLAVFSSYRFPAGEFLNRLRPPVPALVLHGDDDHVVPMAQGQALFSRIGAPKRFVAVRGGDHNDVSPSDPTRYWEAINEFVKSLGGGR